MSAEKKEKEEDNKVNEEGSHGGVKGGAAGFWGDWSGIEGGGFCLGRSEGDGRCLDICIGLSLDDKVNNLTKLLTHYTT